MNTIESARYRGYLNTELIGRPLQLTNIEWWEPDLPDVEIQEPPPLPPRPLIFGKQMEWFFRQQLLSSDRYDLLAENLQIIRNRITIGEIDFILHDKLRNCLVHLEMAFKFYLYDPALPAELPRWIGPNRRDSLLNKLDKLQSRQFPLLNEAETIKALQAHNLPDLPWIQALYMKAQLFLPFDEQDNHPPLINASAVSGFWIPLNRIHELSNHEFYLPRKWNWVVDPAVWQEWYSLDEILEPLKAIITQKKSPMCWMRNRNGKCERFFVVWW